MINEGFIASQLHAPRAIASAVQQASARTGVDFSYLLKQAQVESSFDASAKAQGSSATGLYQFLDQTWLRMVKEHGAEHGQADWANSITQDSSGHFSVQGGKAAKAEILNARKDPEFSALMAGELASENKTTLESKLGRNVNATDLYMAHFLGAGGATTFLKSMQSNPLQAASTLFPDAANANKGVFFDNGRARSLAEVYETFSAKFDNNTRVMPGASATATKTAALEAAAPIDASALLAQNDINNTQEKITWNYPRPYASAATTIAGRETSPLQSMIGGDLLSSPLLALFTSEHAQRGANNDDDSKGQDISTRTIRALAFNA